MAFVPVDQAAAQPQPRRGFVPLDEADTEDGPSTLQRAAMAAEPYVVPAAKTVQAVASGYPVAETAANLLTMGAALPVAGIAGLGAAAGRALGFTEADPAEVVQKVGGALTYQPKTDLGKHLTSAAMYPLEKLAEAGAAAGDKTLDATGSPAAATVVDTAINALPMLIAPAAKGVKAVRQRFREGPAADTAPTANPGRGAPETVEPVPSPAGVADQPAAARGFVPLESIDGNLPSRAQRLAGNDPALHGAQATGVDVLRGTGDNGLPAMDGELRAVPGGPGAGADATSLAGQAQRAGELRAGQLPMDATAAADDAARVLQEGDNQRPGADIGRGGTPSRAADAELGNAANASRVPVGDSGRDAQRPIAAGDIERGRDAAPGRLGADSGDSSGNAAVSDQARLADRASLDARDAALREAADLEARLFAGGDLGPWPMRKAAADGSLQREVIQHARDRYDAIREDLGLPPVDQWTVRPDDWSKVSNRSVTGLEHPAADASGAVQDMAGSVQNSWAPGANYSPMVDQMRAPVSKAKTVADLPDPIRREQIVSDLAKALDTTIYEGRVKGKKRLGFFNTHTEEVRIKHANDIEVAAHEVAHLIDKRVPEIANTWRSDKVLREELKSVSYDQNSVSEGFAEGVRLFLTQPDVLEARAPKVYKWLNDFADSHEYGPALRKAQEQMTGWFAQDALNRARSKIGAEKRLADYFDGFWDKFRQSTVDDLHGIMQMERSMTGKLSPNGPYESARLSRASASIADGAIRFGYPVKARDGSFSWKGRGLEDILKPVAESMDDALLYFVGRSAAELLAQKREHLFTKAEIDGMLRLRTPEREKAFQDYQAWNRGILDFAEAQGIINPESRRLWQRTQYLPFHRVDQPGGMKGKPGDWSGIQALTGGTTNIKDVLGNMVGNATMLLNKSLKNEARLKVAELAQKDGGGKFMAKIDPGERPVKIAGNHVIETLLKKYGITMNGDIPAFFEFLIGNQPPAGNNVVAVLKGGKPVWFEVGDPLLYRALAAIDRPVQSEVVRWLGLPKRIGQASITTVPEFWLANMARDTIMGSVMSRAGFRPIIDSLDGMRMRMTQDPLYKEWVANGGGLSSIYRDEQKLRVNLEKFYSRQGIDYRTVLDTPGRLMNMIETLGDAFESSTRLGEYKRAVQRGDNPRHAAYLARDVSTDFAMKGDSKALGFMYDTVMFLRPALVSWDRLYRGIAHDPNKGAIAAKAGMIALMSAGLYLLNRDDPRYADLPDWDRDSNWHFFVGDQHFRYPKIWEVGAMASGAERSIEKILAEDPEGLGKDFARIIGNTFSLNLMPQIIAPMVEQAANRNSFTKAPIETPGMENQQPFLRAKPGTSETMRAAGMATRDLPESLQVNPTRAEALLRGYFNTWALYGLMLSDQALFGDKLPAKRTDELPVIRRFYANEPARMTKYETMFYGFLEESKRLHGTLKELDHMGRPDLADDKEKGPLAPEYKPLEKASINVRALNHEMLATRRDANLSPEDKRAKLDALTTEKNALLKATVLDSQAAQKGNTPADLARQGTTLR